MHLCRILILSFLICWPHCVDAQESFNPSTIILGDFVFTRPEEWVWKKTEPARKDIQSEVIFGIPHGGYEEAAKAFFNLYEKDAQPGTRGATADRWKSWFPKSKKTTKFSEPVLIGANKVSYFEIAGKYTGPGSVPEQKTECALFGAFIENPGGNIIVRMVGPNNVVRKAEPQLKEMIERALKRE
jgi:hypothetical protein